MAEYLRYVLKNLEPVRVADDAHSQSGQTDTLRYIPGSAIRGTVINMFAGKYDLNTEVSLKKELFSEEVVYTNAYLTTKKYSLIPSPKGFYEDKTEVDGKKELPINIVIKGDPVNGLKRASLGRYCYLQDGCIYYYSVKTGSDLKLKINVPENEKNNIFRNEHISAGQCFEGFIRLPEGKEVKEQIIALFAEGEKVIIGNGRSAGLGKCIVLESGLINTLPYQEKGFEAKNECYMMLLSDTAMRNNLGEMCGLDLSELGKMLGINDLKISFCSTSTREIRGYNRTWQSRIPAILAYEAGSVFHFTYQGVISEQAMEKVSDCGIGSRKNEGLGRVLFLKDYESIRSKLACEYESGFDKPSGDPVLSEEEQETLRTVAEGYYRRVIENAMVQYVINHPVKKNGLKSSQLGTVESILMKNQYNPSEAKRSIDRYFGHRTEKESRQNIQKDRASISGLEKQIRNILDSSLDETLFGKKSPFKEKNKVMGIPCNELISESDIERYKLRLIIDMLKNDYKKEAQ